MNTHSKHVQIELAGDMPSGSCRAFAVEVQVLLRVNNDSKKHSVYPDAAFACDAQAFARRGSDNEEWKLLLPKKHPTLQYSACLYSNPYSNAGEKLHTMAVRSERRTQEWSTRRTSANAGEPSRAFPVCANYSHPYLGSSVSTGDLSRMYHGQRDALYSKRHDEHPQRIPREAMRSAMHFAAESNQVPWNRYPMQGKAYPLRNPQEGTPQRLLLRVPEVAEKPGIGRIIIYELIATGVLPTIRVNRAVRISVSTLQKWHE